MDGAAIGLGAVAGGGVSVVTAYATARFAARQEARRWQLEAAGKYADLVSTDAAAAQNFARQFALGVLIVETGDPATRSKIFVAPHTRMTAGRADLNEIVHPGVTASRIHFAISADDTSVFVEDLGSANGTWVGTAQVRGATKLASGDIITTGNDGVSIEFQRLG